MHGINNNIYYLFMFTHTQIYYEQESKSTLHKV